MKRVQKWQILAITAIIVLIGINEDWWIKPHQNRFHKFMAENQIEYSDAGCEYGWRMTSLFSKQDTIQPWNINPWGALTDSMDVKYEYGEPTYRTTKGDTTEFEFTFEGYNFMFLNGQIISFNEK